MTDKYWLWPQRSPYFYCNKCEMEVGNKARMDEHVKWHFIAGDGPYTFKRIS